MFGLDRWLRWRRPAQTIIDDAAWHEALGRCPVVGHLDDAARGRLRTMAGAFLATKPITPADGLVLSEAMRLAVAIQACVPVLELGLESYAPWVEVIVYPDEFIVEREITDEAGVVHHVREPLSGESWADGPVILSWADIEQAQRQVHDHGDDMPGAAAPGGAGAYSVVVHEFAHKLDMLDGVADGVPPLHAGMNRNAWQSAFSEAFDDLEARIERLERTRGRSSRAHRPVEDAQEEGWTTLPLDPYACKDPGEFFACASEAFFASPHGLSDTWPDVYAQLAQFYRQDPLASGGRAAGHSGPAVHSP
jgi:hypothetical protein